MIVKIGYLCPSRQKCKMSDRKDFCQNNVNPQVNLFFMVTFSSGKK